MKEMPTQELPADSEYIYVPDQDNWIVQKKSGNKILSKKDIKAYEGGYPTENDATTWGAAAPGTYAYQPNINHDAPTGLREGDNGEPITICPICKSNKIDKESNPAKCQVCGTDFVPKPDRGSDDPAVNDYSQNYFWGPNDLGRSHQNQPGANGWLPAGSEDMDGPSPNVRMSSFKSFMHKQSSLNKVAHCGPCSVLKMEALHILIDFYYKDSSLFPEEIIEELSLAATELKIDNFNDILESVIEEYLEEKSEEIGDKLPKLKNLLIALKDIAPKLGKEIPVVDKQANLKQADDRGQQEISQYDPEYQFLIKLINVVTKAGVPASEIKALSTQHPFVTIDDAGDLAAEIWTLATTKYNIPREYLLKKLPKNASLNKQANPPNRFWIAPDGKEFEVAGVHGSWTANNPEILKQYGIKPAKDRYDTGRVWDNMIKSGWVRVSNEPAGTGFVIQVKDMWHPPAFLDDFIAKYFTDGDTVVLASNDQNYLNIKDPFPTLQQVVNKMSRGSKQASLDEVLDQTTQDSIAAEYGVAYLIPLRFYQEALGYGQTPDRAFAYAMQEGKREQQTIDPKQLTELIETYF